MEENNASSGLEETVNQIKTIHAGCRGFVLVPYHCRGVGTILTLGRRVFRAPKARVLRGRPLGGCWGLP